MKILEYPFIWEWCRDLGASFHEAPNQAPRLLNDERLMHCSRVVFAPTGSLGHEAAVADAILNALGPRDESLLWLTRWGVWPSAEDWPTYYALRGRYGQRLSIDDAPAHLIERGEDAAFREILFLVLMNGWDATILPAHDGRLSDRRITISHDGWVEMRAAVADTLDVAGLSTIVG